LDATLCTTVKFKWPSPLDSTGPPSLDSTPNFTLWHSPVRHSPLDSTGSPSLDSTPIVRWTPPDPPLWTPLLILHSGTVQSGTVRWTPPDPPLWTPLPFYTPEESSPAQSGRLHRIPLSGLKPTFTPADSSGVQRTPHVTICDTSGLQMSPDESGGVR
jgi:hypothetical protein